MRETLPNIRMIVRPVKDSDAEVWTELRTRLWPDDGHLEEISHYFWGQSDEPQAVLVAELPPQGIVGCVELSIRSCVANCSSNRVGYIEGLYVVPRARHRGVARALVKASLAWARAEGCLEFASDRADRVVVFRKFLQSRSRA